MLANLLAAVLLGQAPAVPTLPFVMIRVAFACAEGSPEHLAVTPAAPISVQIPERCPGAGKRLSLELACAERCTGRVSTAQGTIAELSGPGALEGGEPFALTERAVGADAGAALPVPRVEVVPKKKAPPPDMNTPLWVSFWWKKPREAACAFRAEPGEYVIIDWKTEIYARAERLELTLARVLVWSHSAGSDEPVAELVMPVPSKTTLDCARLGSLCTGVVDVSIREVDDP